MELYWSILIIIGLMFAYVIYQSKSEPPSINLYVKRFLHLIMLIFTYFKDMGLNAAVKFKEIDWNLSQVN